MNRTKISGIHSKTCFLETPTSIFHRNSLFSNDFYSLDRLRIFSSSFTSSHRSSSTPSSSSLSSPSSATSSTFSWEMMIKTLNMFHQILENMIFILMQFIIHSNPMLELLTVRPSGNSVAVMICCLHRPPSVEIEARGGRMIDERFLCGLALTSHKYVQSHCLMRIHRQNDWTL